MMDWQLTLPISLRTSFCTLPIGPFRSPAFRSLPMRAVMMLSDVSVITLNGGLFDAIVWSSTVFTTLAINIRDLTTGAKWNWIDVQFNLPNWKAPNGIIMFVLRKQNTTTLAIYEYGQISLVRFDKQPTFRCSMQHNGHFHPL